MQEAIGEQCHEQEWCDAHGHRREPRPYRPASALRPSLAALLSGLVHQRVEAAQFVVVEACVAVGDERIHECRT